MTLMGEYLSVSAFVWPVVWRVVVEDLGGRGQQETSRGWTVGGREGERGQVGAEGESHIIPSSSSLPRGCQEDLSVES